MKKFLLYLFFVIIGLFITDSIYRVFCNYIYLHPKKGSDIEKNYPFINDNHYQIIILGASNAQYDFVSQDIEDSLNKSTFNMGWDGRSVIYQYINLIKTIEQGGLETAILTLTPNQLSDEWVCDRMSELYPYYWYDDDIRQVINEVDGNKMNFLMCSALLQYNSKLYDLHKKAVHYDGFVPLPYTGEKCKIQKVNHITKFNAIGVKYFARIVQKCFEKGIELIVCVTPDLSISEKEINSIIVLCNKYNVKVWNMVSSVSDPYLFRDGAHLNVRGAHVFTKIIVDRYKKEHNLGGG